MNITVGLRSSKLSLRQFEEVKRQLTLFAPHISLVPMTIETIGDRDLKTSLREMEKTDFFTREIDLLQLEGKCRISLHSAKDLPSPLLNGLKLIALTKGVDCSDVLVFREGESLEMLRSGARVGSSSVRRDQVIKRLRPDLFCVEIRGNIEKRLEKLFSGEIDALAIAEAALIRLNITHLNKIFLPGTTAPLQGQLAVVAREDDSEVEALFKPIDSRKAIQTTLYLGLDPINFKTSARLIHCPIIRTVSRPFDSIEIRHIFQDIPDFTHLIFTSRAGVKFFFTCLSDYGYSNRDLSSKKIFVIGNRTAAAVRERGCQVTQIAKSETQEGVIEMLVTQDLDQSYLLLAISSLARLNLSQFLMNSCIRHQICHLYDTKSCQLVEKPDLSEIDEIVFTSPSTVSAFKKNFGEIPKDKKLTSIGPITAQLVREASR